MSGLLIITGEDDSLGFRLGGFECRELSEGDDVCALLEDIVEGGKYGLVCIEERFYERLSKELMRRIKKKGLPVLMPINIPQAWQEAAPGESTVARLIRKAIGYQIKIRK